MFGPLPLLHRVVIAAVSLACGVLAGAWVTHVTTLPMMSLGGLVGGLLGLVAVYAVIHQRQPRPVRITRRR